MLIAGAAADGRVSIPGQSVGEGSGILTPWGAGCAPPPGVKTEPEVG